MKKISLLKIFVLLLIVSCSNDNEQEQFDGSQASLEDLFSVEVVQTLEELNFTINEGIDPPNLEGTILISPLILTASNIPQDEIGRIYNDQRYTFFNQNNSENTIDLTGESLSGSTVSSEIEGNGSFISGSGNNFSVFFIVTSERVQNGAMADSAYSISGTITDEGIIDLEFALIMLDNRGNSDQFIANGDGRNFIDQDGLSEFVDPTSKRFKNNSKTSKNSKNIFCIN